MIKVRKIVAINENTIYRNCCVCGKELSPYQVESGLSLTTIKILELTDLILGKLNNKFVILLCNKCLKIKEINNGETT